jgi:hypothetical protein
MLRPTKRGSIQTKFETNPDFAVALGWYQVSLKITELNG